MRGLTLFLVLICGCNKDGDGKSAAGAGKGAGGGVKSELDTYKAKSMATEGRLAAMRMAKGALIGAEPGLKPPPGDTGLVPSAPCCKQPDGKCPYDAALWRGEPWQTLAFEADLPHRYQYQFISDEKGFTARAVGDLDCDGVQSTFELKADWGGQLPDKPVATNELD